MYLHVPIEKIEFVGLIADRDFLEITTNEFMNALAKMGWGEAHNAHIFMRLRERGRLWGIRTPGDFSRALRRGYTIPAEDEAKARVCCGGQCWVIFRAEHRRFITIRPPKSVQKQ